MSFRSTIVLLLVLTSLAGCDRHNAATPQATASDSSPPAPSGASKEGPVGKLDRSHKGEAAQTAAFIDPAGKPVTLAAFKGKPVLVNMWATWCGPCVAEMPKLDQVAARMTVVAVSQDLGADAPTKVRAFLAKAKLARIQPFTDPDAKLSTGYGADLPTTILYDSNGHEQWRATGGLDWTSDASRALLAEAH